MVGDVLGDGGACADDGVVADVDALEDDAVGTDEGVLADGDGLGAWGEGTGERERVHVAVAEEGASADEGVFAEGDAAEGDEAGRGDARAGSEVDDGTGTGVEDGASAVVQRVGPAGGVDGAVVIQDDPPPGRDLDAREAMDQRGGRHFRPPPSAPPTAEDAENEQKHEARRGSQQETGDRRQETGDREEGEEAEGTRPET